MGTALIFLAPALILLGALLVYPIVYTLVRSFFGADAGEFVGGKNYLEMFTDPSTFQAIRNNIIWVVVAPLACTVLGLIFAVLMDRVRWATAFKLIIFMPMAISMVAAGVIFRTVFQEDPQLGAANAALVSVHDFFAPSSEYPGARERRDAGIATAESSDATQGVTKGSISSDGGVAAGTNQDFPLIAIKQEDVPEDAKAAGAAKAAAPDQIAGTVWLDVVRGGGGTPGQIDPGKRGLPGVEVRAVDDSGKVAGTAKTGDDGSYTISGLASGSYTVTLPAENFRAPYAGVPWLGPSLITFVIILAYVWIWAGFAMVMVAAGLSAVDRSLQEAARIDGASEWKVFTKITAPLVAPVLVVVFITLLINVLKIFDLVYVIPPGSSKPAANVIAVQMWTVSFGGGNNQGLGSALAILLLVLVLPSMIINIRRFRREN
jgi:alpha-glucoside transport system permease protein